MHSIFRARQLNHMESRGSPAGDGALDQRDILSHRVRTEPDDYKILHCLLLSSRLRSGQNFGREPVRVWVDPTATEMALLAEPTVPIQGSSVIRRQARDFELSPKVGDDGNRRRHIVGVLEASTSPPKERYAVSNDNVIKLIQSGLFDDQLTEILRNGARALLAKAVEAEVADFLDKQAD
ncbi:hypothetical protein ABIB66_008489 [Bradyrhizobium sp. F1.13.3]